MSKKPTPLTVAIAPSGFQLLDGLPHFGMNFLRAALIALRARVL
jgi:hypothetical protein